MSLKERIEDYIVSEDEKARLRYEGMQKYTWICMRTGQTDDFYFVMRDLLLLPVFVMGYITFITGKVCDTFWGYIIVDGLYLINFLTLAFLRKKYFKEHPIEKEPREEWRARMYKKLDELEELEKLKKQQKKTEE